jgi:hypothetical protein
VIERLPSKHKTLNSNPVNTKEGGEGGSRSGGREEIKE